MWKFSAAMVLAAACLAAGPPLQDPSAYQQPGPGSMFDHTDAGPALDRDALRAAVDDTEPLFDGLARETRRLDKAAKDALFLALKLEYNLGSQVSAARRLLEESEAVLDLQDAIRNQQAVLKQAGPDAPDGEAQAKKALDLQSDLMSTVAELRRALGNQQKDLNEKETQQLRDWLMISEGQLRRRREEAEAAAQAHPAADAPPLDAAGVSPSAGAKP